MEKPASNPRVISAAFLQGVINTKAAVEVEELEFQEFIELYGLAWLTEADKAKNKEVRELLRVAGDKDLVLLSVPDMVYIVPSVIDDAGKASGSIRYDVTSCEPPHAEAETCYCYADAVNLLCAVLRFGGWSEYYAHRK
jgi:hypothetical protein